MKVKVGGVWKSGVPHVKVSGVWKKASAVWTKVLGVWEKMAFLFRIGYDNTVINMVRGPDAGGKKVLVGSTTAVGASLEQTGMELKIASDANNRCAHTIKLTFNTLDNSNKVKEELQSRVDNGSTILNLKATKAGASVQGSLEKTSANDIRVSGPYGSGASSYVQVKVIDNGATDVMPTLNSKLREWASGVSIGSTLDITWDVEG